MTRHKRSWTAAEVATALAMVQACGGSVEAASRECGVPARTLYRWLADPRDRIGETERGQTARARMVEAALPNARAALADKLERVANRCFDAITPAKVRASKDIRALATSGAIAIDKMRLLREQPPQPTEAEQRMADAVAQAAEAIVQMAAQAGRTISLDDARKQICAIQLKHSELTSGASRLRTRQPIPDETEV